MKPIINLDDAAESSICLPDSLKGGSEEAGSNLPLPGTVLGIRCKRGVYRFHSHEEADRWMEEHIVQIPANESGNQKDAKKLTPGV